MISAARTSAGAAGGVLSRLRSWWRRRRELDTMDPQELGWIAQDIAVSVSELKELAARGPHAADLLHERLHALGVSKDDVERVAPGLMRDLERTCSCCTEKGACRRDLAEAADDRAWESYCPNAAGLTCVKVATERLPA